MNSQETVQNTENQKTGFSAEELLYYLFLAVILFTKGVGLEESTALFRGCLLAGGILLACKFAIGAYSLPELALTALLGVWGCYTFHVTGSLGMLIYVMMIVGMKHVPLKRAFAVGAVVWSVCMAYTLTMGIFFKRYGVRLIHEKLGLGPILRESLGYTHPNVLHITYLVLMAFLLYLYRQKGKKLLCFLAVLLIGDAFVFLYSVSYTGLLFSFVLIALYLYFIYRKKISKAEAFLIQCLPAVCLTISVIVPAYIRDGIVYDAVNKLVNNRLWAMRVYLENYSLTLLGDSRHIVGVSLDNSYINSLKSYGIIGFALILLVYFLLLRYYIRRGDRRSLAVICAFMLAGLSEPFLFNASVKNITVLMIGSMLYQTMEKRERKYVLTMFPGKNRTFYCDTDKIGMFAGRIGKGLRKGSVVTAFLAGAVVFVLGRDREFIRYREVYADERMCDVSGETVSLPEGELPDSALILGETNRNIGYYYYTRENSSLIRVEEIRMQVSISVYIAAAVWIAADVIFGFAWDKRRGKADDKASG